MKPVYLEFCGINSFSERAEIDFRSLLDGGIFGIFGDTGSGKSTILDCIHLALYGRIERSSGSECIHYALDSAYVVFEFEITRDGCRHTYRVRRERRRKNNGSKAWLYEILDGKELALAEGTRDVDDAVEKIVGLTFADFKTCIALPQGDFATLVKATPSDRVKLVSRLFDLEKYGEKLFKATSERFFNAETQVNLLKAKMEQYDSVSDEILAQKRASVKVLEGERDTAEKHLTLAQEKYDSVKTLQKAKEEYDKLCRDFALLQTRYPQMEEKRKLVGRIPQAKTVVKTGKTLSDLRKDMQTTNVALNLDKDKEERFLFEWENAKKKQAESGFEDEITAVKIKLDKVQNAQKDILAEENAQKQYDDSLKEYRKLQKETPYRNFEEEKEKIEKEISALGEDESLTEYLKHNFKDLLLADAYGVFRADLRILGEKYPETEEDINRLLQKYTLRESDGVLDFAQAQLAFKEIERRRKALKTELEKVEKAKRAYDENESKKKSIAEQGKIYHETLLSIQERTKEVKLLGSETDLKSKLSALENAKKSLDERVEKAQKDLQKTQADIQTKTALLQSGKERETQLLAEIESLLVETGFASLEEAVALYKQYPDENALKAECEKFFNDYTLLQSKISETDEKAFADFDENALRIAQEEKTNAQILRDEKQKELAVAEKEILRLESDLEKCRAFEKELKEKEKEKNLCEELRNLLKGNKFLEFIASEYLQEVCVYASQTLSSLTSGRYFLRYDKEFCVGDNLDGGNLRAVKTLSGGETFLVSLSLALSLGTAICQKSLRPIEFFFLDEGFGTLDDKLVDTVMDVLGKLKSRSLSVGLISHVEELKRRIDNKILVTGANESHGSTLRIERF